MELCMEHRLLFYPVGNGDTSQIVLNNGKRILFDFRHIAKTEDEKTSEINLKRRLKSELEDFGVDEFDVVAFTHCDKDHIENSTSFFELLHAEKYKSDDRIKINTLWVPASMIIETATNDQQSSEFIIWRQEARHRLKEGKGIRVFSKPDKLKEWFDENDLTIESRKHLITDAGQIVPEFNLENDGVEFFSHSPFIKNVDEGQDLRNEAALIFNIRFKIEETQIDYFAVGDSEYKVLEDIINISKTKGNDERLNWDIFNIPHHCSYKALGEEKGDRITNPTDTLKKLLKAGNEGAYLVCSSNIMTDTDDSYNQDQPPHIQAKKCYEKYLDEINGCKMLVTMEESDEEDPEPIEFIIKNDGVSLKGKETLAAGIIFKRTPKAGVN